MSNITTTTEKVSRIAFTKVCMLKMSQLKNIVIQGESETVEFKKSTAQLSIAMHTVSAFLNSETGGILLIGVTDDKKILGQVVSDGTRREIAVELSKIEPQANISVEYIAVTNDRYVIALMVKAGIKAPYIYDGRAFIRSQSTTSKMSQEKYEQLLQGRRLTSVAWESLATNTCTSNDLDKKRIQQVVNMAVSERRLTDSATQARVNEVLKKFNLLVGDRLTNAAVILFCKNVEKQFIQSVVRLARFRGLNKTEFIDNKIMRGNLFDLFEGTLSFLESYLPVAGKIEEGNPLRIDTPAIPLKALREALINAFCHRDYTLHGGSIDIAIYDDRVEISNTGPLLPDIKLSELSKKHQSFTRNPLIASVLFTCRMIEQWGRGTLDMIELCKKSNNPSPKFEETAGGFSVLFPLREPLSRVSSTAASPIGLTSRQQEIMNLLKDHPLSRKQVSEKMKNPPGDRVLQKELLKLKTLMLIGTVGSGKSVQWLIKS
ncbi:putative DNA binding domain-containing protein [Candidatus Dependentiae bacterium]|nr:putative DNA binding domain-containing protein [Candidatus Dependentiae bacterium]